MNRKYDLSYKNLKKSENCSMIEDKKVIDGVYND